MKIEKIINNNVVTALDENGKEIVAMGKGIGFGRKAGQELLEKNVEKIFRLESPDVLEHFKEMIAKMPMACVKVSDEIITHARQVLSTELNQSVYLTLTDHIDFALKRMRAGMLFENALFSEIKRFYPAEFAIGRYALELIETRMAVRLPEEEAASIAFHLVNAETGIQMRQTYAMTEMIRHLVEMVNDICPLEEDFLYTDRLVTNLKFLLNRLFLHKPYETNRDPVLNEFIRSHCPEEYDLAIKMKDYMQTVTGCEVTEEELTYLTVQLKYTISIYDQRG